MMGGIVSTLYRIKKAIEKEYGLVPQFNVEIGQNTPADNLGIDVHLDGVVYPFYVADGDFDDIPLLISFMIEHIEVQRNLLKGSTDASTKTQEVTP